MKITMSHSETGSLNTEHGNLLSARVEFRLLFNYKFCFPRWAEILLSNMEMLLTRNGNLGQFAFHQNKGEKKLFGPPTFSKRREDRVESLSDIN